MQTYNLSIITIEDSIASIKSKLRQIINIGSVSDSTSFEGRKAKVYFHSIIISFVCMQTYNLSIITIEDSIASIKSKL
jgi:hypothetical protein